MLPNTMGDGRVGDGEELFPKECQPGILSTLSMREDGSPSVSVLEIWVKYGST